MLVVVASAPRGYISWAYDIDRSVTEEVIRGVRFETIGQRTFLTSDIALSFGCREEPSSAIAALGPDWRVASSRFTSCSVRHSG